MLSVPRLSYGHSCAHWSSLSGFWYAGILVSRGEMKAGDALAVFFAVVLGALGLGQAYEFSYA